MSLIWKLAATFIFFISLYLYLGELQQTGRPAGWQLAACVRGSGGVANKRRRCNKDSRHSGHKDGKIIVLQYWYEFVCSITRMLISLARFWDHELILILIIVVSVSPLDNAAQVLILNRKLFQLQLSRYEVVLLLAPKPETTNSSGLIIYLDIFSKLIISLFSTLLHYFVCSNGWQTSPLCSGPAPRLPK